VSKGFKQKKKFSPKCLLRHGVSTCFCVVLCVGFCTGHLVMMPLNLTYLHCLHYFFEHLFILYYVQKLTSEKRYYSLTTLYVIYKYSETSLFGNSLIRKARDPEEFFRERNNSTLFYTGNPRFRNRTVVWGTNPCFTMYIISNASSFSPSNN